MFVRCPGCGAVNRVQPIDGQSNVRNYFCPDCRSIFRIDLREHEIASTSVPDSIGKVEHRHKILVADDEAVIRDLAEELLAAAGYEVLKAADGEQALQLIINERPDLILLDLMLPRITGFQVLLETRKSSRFRETPILILSALVAGENTDSSIHELDAAGFLDKTDFVTSLVTRVQEILSRQSSLAA